MRKKKYFAAAITFVCICILMSGVYIKAMADTQTDRICKGVFIDSIDLGGMTEAEAQAAVDVYLDELKKKSLTIKVDTNEITTTLSELGYECVENDYITQALNVGKNGNLIKRYKELRDVEHNQLVYTLAFTLDDVSLHKLVDEKCSSFNIEPVNATIARKDGKFIVSKDEIGRKIDVTETIQKIKNTILVDWNFENVAMDAIVIDAIPEYSTDILKQCKDVIGTFSTTYASSSASRANNLANAARLINGTVVYPGDTFSAGKSMQPITEENGYQIAGAYFNGQVIDSVGGGVCQVATTLYNAVLNAELEVVERSNHSMIVGYVPAARDAAIAGDYKDFKFKNNSEIPIYVEVYTVGRKITFVLYGKETRDTTNRKVEYISEVTKTIQPGKEKVTKDPTKPISYRSVTQAAHVGYKAYLWKVVTIDGVEVSREQVNFSSYAAEPAYVTIGTKEEPKKEEPKATPKPTAKPTAKPTKEPDEDSQEDTDEDTNEDVIEE